jgi:hypothetical protein
MGFCSVIFNILTAVSNSRRAILKRLLFILLRLPIRMTVLAFRAHDSSMCPSSSSWCSTPCFHLDNSSPSRPTTHISSGNGLRRTEAPPALHFLHVACRLWVADHSWKHCIHTPTPQPPITTYLRRKKDDPPCHLKSPSISCAIKQALSAPADTKNDLNRSTTAGICLHLRTNDCRFDTYQELFGRS